MASLPTGFHAPRLTLRRWVEADAPALGAAIRRSIEHLRPWMPWIEHEPLTDAARAGLIRQWDDLSRAGDGVLVGMFVGDTVVGSAGLHHRDGPMTLEVGYWVHVDHVGHGYATEAAIALTDAAFATAGIDWVEIVHDVANVASGAVASRAGFELVGQHARAITAPGMSGISRTWRTDGERWAQRRPRHPPSRPSLRP